MREWAETIALVILLFFVLGIFFWVKSINDREVATAQTQAQQGAAFEQFLHSFTAENNYDCRVLWEINRHTASLPFAPSPSVCVVTAP
jgi:hypothetical protein